MINRRDALRRIGQLAGAATLPKFLASCGDDGGGPVGITNYVFLMLENRTYDHVFGARSMLEGKAGDGLVATMTNPDLAGNPVSLYVPSSAISDICVVADPSHSWNPSRAQFNNGLNDGFIRVHQANHPGQIEPMQYLTRVEQPVSWALADHYTTCDRWFAAVMGPTQPNRYYWYAASSAGYKTNDILDDSTPINLTTIFHRLRDANIDWVYYYSSLPHIPAINERLVADLKFPTDYIAQSVRSFGDSETEGGRFFADAAEGTLPTVSYIDPFFYLNDDHPPAHPLLAQQMIAAVYKALATSPQWKNCMLVIAYDEHGGFFDHVPPPKIADDTLANYPLDENGMPADGFDQLGFRVPAMVIGPYVKQGYVSSVEYNHASALKHLGTAFELPDLNARMAASNDLADCIDMDRLARGDWAPPIDVPEIVVNNDERFNRVSITASGQEWPWAPVCIEGGGEPRLADPFSIAADRNPHLFEGYDLRSQYGPYLRGLAEFLKRKS